MFISIKHFLEERRLSDKGGPDLLEALRQMGQLLLEGIGTHAVHGSESDLEVLRQTLKEVSGRIEQPASEIDVLSVSSDAILAMETYGLRTNAYLNEGNEQLRSMVSMLTETVADLSGHADASVSHLQTIEKQIEQASGLEDRRALRASLENCLLALREAAAQQRSSTQSTVQRLQSQIAQSQQRGVLDGKQSAIGKTEIELLPEAFEDPGESAALEYVAAFKLQRAEHIATRFGDGARNQMIALIGTHLKGALGPADRLLRWKGTSFVMFLHTSEPAREVRRRLAESVAAIGQHHVEVGRKTALLSVGVDWIVFPQAQCPSLEAVFTEVDAFLANTRPGIPPAVEVER